MNFQFRDYQQAAVDAAMEYIEDKKRKHPELIVAPTAAGKSWIIAGIAKRHVGRILVLQSVVELLNQNYEKFCSIGGEATLYSASVGKKEISNITYATIGSIKKEAENLKDFDLVIFDECHLFLKAEKGSVVKDFIDIVKPKKCIGLTATPFRLVSNSYGTILRILTNLKPKFFKGYIHITQISEMIERGYWTPSKDEYWEFDESKLQLNITGSEFTDESIKIAVKDCGVNNNIYARIKALQNKGERKSILVFVDSLDNADMFAKLFPNSACLTSKTSKKQREQIIKDFTYGRLSLLFNHKILTTGFDHPQLDCIIQGYPTNSLALIYQIYGRGTRIHSDKKNFLFIDCCGNLQRLGHPREISFQQVEGKGICMFTGKNLKSGVTLGSSISITKEELEAEYDKKENPSIMPFGKYKNTNIEYLSKIDPEYLEWIITQDIDRKLKTSIQSSLKSFYITTS